jgi:hypothetical protein
MEHKCTLSGIRSRSNQGGAFESVFRFLTATRYFFSYAARLTMGTTRRAESSVHVHWDRVARQWVRRELG